MSHIDNNDDRSSEPIKYILDLDTQDEAAPSDTRQIPELDIVKRLREDAIKSVSESFSRIGAFNLTPSYKAMSEMAKSISESTKKAFEDTLNTSKLIPDVTDLQNQLLRSSDHIVSSFEQIHRHNSSNLLPSLPATNILSEFAKNTAASLAHFNIPSIALDLSNIISSAVGSSIAYVIKSVSSIDLSSLVGPLYKYFRRQYELVIAASVGDTKAAETLADWWFLSRGFFFLLQRLKGSGLSDEELEGEFVHYVQLKCFQYAPGEKVLKRHWLKIYTGARMFCASQLYKELRTSHREQLVVAISEEQYHLIPTFEHEGKRYIFVWVAAAIASRTDQAIRNMIRKGTLPSIRHKYQNRYRQSNDYTYLIPWDENMLVQLLEIAHPDVALDRRGLISAQDVCEHAQISDRTLWRLEDEGFVIPTRLSGNKRYYTSKDFKKILLRLANSKSPRLRARKFEFEALLLKYSS